MRYDLTPLYRSTVGFDRLFELLDGMIGTNDAPAYPPYNIEKTGEQSYRVTMAVAGFSEADLHVEVKEQTLTVKGAKPAAEGAPQARQVLFQGIAARAFERRFQLADHVQITGASLEHGLLHIDLVREVPEAKKLRSIPISVGAAGPRVIEQAAA
jgi:molecular chaperone IbpA